MRARSGGPGSGRPGNDRSERLGLLFAGLCALNGAFVPAVAKLTTGLVEPLLVAAVSSSFAGLAALIVLWIGRELPVLVRRDVAPGLLAIGALGTALAHALFFWGAHRTSAIEATLCLQMEPVYALLVSYWWLGHPVTRRRLLACALTLAGIAIAIGATRARLTPGVAVLLATPLCWQLSHVLVLRTLPHVSPPVLTGARYAYGGVLLALFFAGRRMLLDAPAPLPAWDTFVTLLPLLALQGVVLAYTGTMLWYQAIARLDLARATAIVVPSIPLLSFGTSFLLLGEVATPMQWVGLGATALGVLLFVTAPGAVRPGEHIPAPTAPLLTPEDREPR